MSKILPFCQCILFVNRWDSYHEFKNYFNQNCFKSFKKDPLATVSYHEKGDCLPFCVCELSLQYVEYCRTQLLELCNTISKLTQLWSAKRFTLCKNCKTPTPFKREGSVFQGSGVWISPRIFFQQKVLLLSKKGAY